jgi:tetratricopeptide (TPR) repeat protein
MFDNYELWPPERTGRIEGSTSEERATLAAELAGRIKANLIIYGVITQTGELTSEFYVGEQGFERGQELIGPHTLGGPLPVPLPFPQTLSGLAIPGLTARFNALNLITIGLAALFIEQPQIAIDYFHKAEQIPEWVDSAGKEIVYLLDGDANLQRASMEKTLSPLIAATDAFSKALEINPDYARAKLGLAGVAYLQALTDPTNINRSTVDRAKLDEAERAFQEAGTLQAPPSAKVSTKIAFGLGQIYLVRGGILSDTEQLARAHSEFEAVINDYLSATPSDQYLLEDLAGQAYARLGLLARLQRDWPTAIEYYQQAFLHVTPTNKAVYKAALGEIYLAEGNTAEAIKAYDAAQSIAESNGDPTSHDKYLAILKKIQNGQ